MFIGVGDFQFDSRQPIDYQSGLFRFIPALQQHLPQLFADLVRAIGACVTRRLRTDLHFDLFAVATTARRVLPQHDGNARPFVRYQIRELRGERGLFGTVLTRGENQTD